MADAVRDDVAGAPGAILAVNHAVRFVLELAALAALAAAGRTVLAIAFARGRRQHRPAPRPGRRTEAVSTATTVDELAAGRAEPRRRRGHVSGSATLFHAENVADTVRAAA